ncbi:GNAT family N-acetyltransferase [Candidatus Bathyarchaeota archaeon]|nr:GNAT family N-acetyltransferase [Candidatus Bathyarchaeota archaeon]
MPKIVSRTAMPDDMEDIELLIKRAFDNPSAHGRPYPALDLVIITEMDGEIVGHVSIRPIDVIARGSRVCCGVLHMVCIDPSHQREGIGTAMLHEAARVMDEEGLLISLLETPVPRFYELSDWCQLPPKKTLVLTRSIVNKLPSDGRVELVEITGDRGIDLVRSCSRSHDPLHDIVAVDNRSYLEIDLADHLQGSITKFLHGITLSGKPIGFIVGERGSTYTKEGTLNIKVERCCFINPPSLEIISQACKGLFSFDEEFTEIHFKTPLAPSLISSLEKAGSTIIHQGNIDMLRINSVSRFLEAISPHLEETWLNHVEEIIERVKVPEFALQVAGETILFRFSREKITISDFTCDIDLIPSMRISRKELASLVCGHAGTLDLIRSRSEKAILQDAMTQLSLVFPERETRVRYNSHSFRAFTRLARENPPL